ncbi:MAG: hypothetical protein LBF72_01045 [Holosporales bacterium]|nr:hypothetical protein [Holosporales bacterium]
MTQSRKVRRIIKRSPNKVCDFAWNPVQLECSRTSKYAPLLCSVSPSQNSDFEGFERGPLIRSE